MFTKHKIRRAFKRATPDVLANVLKECTAVQKDNQPARETVSASAPLRWMPHWLKETAATAAAVALFVAVISSVFYFGGSQYHTGNTEPTIDTQTQPSESSTTPTHHVMHESPEDIAWNFVWPLICPDTPEPGTDDWDSYHAYTKNNTTINTSTDGKWTYYQIVVHHNGYTYDFTYRGEPEPSYLHSISIIPCDCVKDGYISEDVALAMAQLYCGNRLKNEVWATTIELVENFYGTHYWIKYVNDDSSITLNCYVNCINGNISEELLVLTEEEAINIAINYFKLNSNDYDVSINLDTSYGVNFYFISLTNRSTHDVIACVVNGYTGEVWIISDDSSSGVEMDCCLFVYDGTNPTMSKNPDLTDCVVGAFYCMDYQTDEVYFICEEEVSVYNSTNTHVYFVKADAPTKIYCAHITDFTQHEIIYESAIGEINRIYEMPAPFENDALSVLEGNKRFGVLNLNDGTMTVFTEQYYIANAYIDDDGAEVDSWEDFNIVYFEGKLNEDSELKGYLHYQDTGELKEDGRL